MTQHYIIETRPMPVFEGTLQECQDRATNSSAIVTVEAWDRNCEVPISKPFEFDVICSMAFKRLMHCKLPEWYEEATGYCPEVQRMRFLAFAYRLYVRKSVICELQLCGEYLEDIYSRKCLEGEESEQEATN